MKHPIQGQTQTKNYIKNTLTKNTSYIAFQDLSKQEVNCANKTA